MYDLGRIRANGLQLLLPKKSYCPTLISTGCGVSFIIITVPVVCPDISACDNEGDTNNSANMKKPFRIYQRALTYFAPPLEISLSSAEVTCCFSPTVFGTFSKLSILLPSASELRSF